MVARRYSHLRSHFESSRIESMYAMYANWSQHDNIEMNRNAIRLNDTMIGNRSAVTNFTHSPMSCPSHCRCHSFRHSSGAKQPKRIPLRPLLLWLTMMEYVWWKPIIIIVLILSENHWNGNFCTFSISSFSPAESITEQPKGRWP